MPLLLSPLPFMKILLLFNQRSSLILSFLPFAPFCFFLFFFTTFLLFCFTVFTRILHGLLFFITEKEGTFIRFFWRWKFFSRVRARGDVGGIRSPYLPCTRPLVHSQPILPSSYPLWCSFISSHLGVLWEIWVCQFCPSLRPKGDPRSSNQARIPRSSSHLFWFCSWDDHWLG